MHSRSETRTYVGRLEAGAQAVYVVDPAGVGRLTPPGAGFGWGVDAVGNAMELARTLLADATGREPGSEASERFVAQILSRLPHDGFTLQRDTVGAWMRRTVSV